MAEDADVGVFQGAEDAGGGLFDGLVEVGVDAGDDDVHLGEGGVVEIEGAVGEDVDLDAGEDADFSGVLFAELIVDLADALDVFEGAEVVEAAGHGEGFGVIGDGDVAEAAGHGGFGHLTDGVAAVGGVGVHVEIAVDVGADDEVGEGVVRRAAKAGGGGFDLAGVFAELGRDVVEVKGLVDFGFGGGRDDSVCRTIFCEAGEGVLV